jgi:HK97 family phage major capsid protein
MNIQSLREQRTAIAREVKNLLDANPGPKWNAAHQSAYDELVSKIDGADAEIKRWEKVAEIAADEAFGNEALKSARKKGVDLGEDDPRRVFDVLVRKGFENAKADDQIRIRNTMSTTTGSEGGYTVPSLIASTIYDAMKAFGTMRAVAEILPTSDGRPLSFPGSDGTSETGEWIAQNTTATAADPTFTTVSLNVFKASSKIVAIPFELLQDTNIDMEAFIRARLAQRLGRLGNTGFTVGTGTTQPDGIMTRASSGKVGTTGQTTSIIYDDLVDLVHAVDPALPEDARVMMPSGCVVPVPTVKPVFPRRPRRWARRARMNASMSMFVSWRSSNGIATIFDDALKTLRLTVVNVGSAAVAVVFCAIHSPVSDVPSEPGKDRGRPSDVGRISATARMVPNAFIAS